MSDIQKQIKNIDKAWIEHQKKHGKLDTDNQYVSSLKILRQSDVRIINYIILSILTIVVIVEPIKQYLMSITNMWIMTLNLILIVLSMTVLGLSYMFIELRKK